MKMTTITITAQALDSLVELSHLIPLSRKGPRGWIGAHRTLSLVLQEVDPRTVTKPMGRRRVGPTITVSKETRDTLTEACDLAGGLTYSDYIEVAASSYSTPTIDALRRVVAPRSVASPLMYKHFSDLRRQGRVDEVEELNTPCSAKREQLLARTLREQIDLDSRALATEIGLCKIIPHRSTALARALQADVLRAEEELKPMSFLLTTKSPNQGAFLYYLCYLA